MTQEALKLALDALETELSIDWTNNDEFNASAEKMYEAIAAIKEALAQEQALQALHDENERLGLYKDAYAQPEQDFSALVTGMEVSIDVSTGDHDSGHRLFGVVDLVQQSQGSKHGLILLVQETKANFKEALAQPKQEPVCPECKAGVLYECVACSSNNYPLQRTWVGLTDEEFDDLRDNNFGVSPLISAVEAKLKEKNT